MTATLTLSPITPGALTLSASATTTSTKVYCSNALPCSNSLKCGETGIGLADRPVGTLTLAAA